MAKDLLEERLKQQHVAILPQPSPSLSEFTSTPPNAIVEEEAGGERGKEKYDGGSVTAAGTRCR